ncbi:MAG: elongation factor P--(R)-beta-lysine ligase [Gammaproteobacteria bacterium]|nr:elongation factor P--(R)-beta-lysine ligase [Gammaproteobacteria bacterium]
MSAPLWQPSAALDTLHQRARFMALTRQFFDARGYLEVETPIMARFGITDVYLSNIQAQFRGQDYALQTSPEYHMKRLLAAGSGPIFQLARVFRDDELGRWHNPEFTLLEWYQLDVDHHTLLAEVDTFLQTVVGCPPLQKHRYQDVFQRIAEIDPLNSTWQTLKSSVTRFGLDGVLDPEEQDIDQYLFLLMSHVIEPALASAPQPTAIYDFPVSQAALARIEQGCAARFEVYFRGIELANGFYELTDPASQSARFAADNQLRAAQGKPQAEIDPRFLDALSHGLPACSGVALGVDRALALACDQNNLASCLAFDFSRA